MSGDSYAASGVNIDKANEAISMFKEKVFSTFNANVLNDLASFAGLYRLETEKYKEPVLVSSTDGVGTKILLAKQANNFDTIGQDLVAMCVNDIICCGAEPLFFLDYIACGKLIPEKIQSVVGSVAEGCKISQIALIGGETAEMPGLYKDDDMDLAGFAVGIVDRKSIIDKEKVREGDLVFGIKSSGPHSNGYSLIRKLISDNEFKLDVKYDFDEVEIDLAHELLKPTRIYVSVIKQIKEKISIKGIANITGGGFYENINRIIPGNCDVEIDGNSWDIPIIFRFIQKYGKIDPREMFRVFNMGIGMVIIIDKNDSDTLQMLMKSLSEEAIPLGSVITGTGNVIIKNL
jgi:phosphoribosylformylglycinamidine cyclo-ligase